MSVSNPQSRSLSGKRYDLWSPTPPSRSASMPSQDSRPAMQKYSTWAPNRPVKTATMAIQTDNSRVDSGQWADNWTPHRPVSRTMSMATLHHGSQPTPIPNSTGRWPSSSPPRHNSMAPVYEEPMSYQPPSPPLSSSPPTREENWEQIFEHHRQIFTEIASRAEVDLVRKLEESTRIGDQYMGERALADYHKIMADLLSSQEADLEREVEVENMQRALAARLPRGVAAMPPRSHTVATTSSHSAPPIRRENALSLEIPHSTEMEARRPLPTSRYRPPATATHPEPSRWVPPATPMSRSLPSEDTIHTRWKPPSMEEESPAMRMAREHQEEARKAQELERMLAADSRRRERERQAVAEALQRERRLREEEVKRRAQEVNKMEMERRAQQAEMAKRGEEIMRRKREEEARKEKEQKEQKEYLRNVADGQARKMREDSQRADRMQEERRAEENRRAEEARKAAATRRAEEARRAAEEARKHVPHATSPQMTPQPARKPSMQMPPTPASTPPRSQQDEARWRQEQQERLAAEQKAKFEAEQRRAREADIRRQAGGVDNKKRISDAWDSYNSRWSTLSNLEVLRFGTIPWPTLVPPTSPEGITSTAVAAFVLSPHHSQNKARKDRLRDALLRWHPDRFNAKWLNRVADADKEAVREGAGSVIRVLNELQNQETNPFGE